MVGGQEADADRGDPHGEQSDDEGGFAADAIAEVSEEGRADGTGEEGDAESGEGVETRGCGISRREEEAGKNENGGGGEDVEIEELNGGADEAGDEDLGRRVDRPFQGSAGFVHGNLREQSTTESAAESTGNGDKEGGCPLRESVADAQSPTT